MNRRSVWLVSVPSIVLCGVFPLALGVPVFVLGLHYAPEDLGGVVFGALVILPYLACVPRWFVRVTPHHVCHGRFPFRRKRVPGDSIRSVGTYRRQTFASVRDVVALELHDGSIIPLAIWSYGPGGPTPNEVIPAMVRRRDRVRDAIASTGCDCADTASNRPEHSRGGTSLGEAATPAGSMWTRWATICLRHPYWNCAAIGTLTGLRLASTGAGPTLSLLVGAGAAAILMLVYPRWVLRHLPPHTKRPDHVPTGDQHSE